MLVVCSYVSVTNRRFNWFGVCNMKKFALLAGIMTALACPSLASAMTEVECTAAWTKADANGDGVLSAPEGARYMASLRVADKPVTDGKLTQPAFIAHCRAGHFNTAQVEAGAPLPGSNSFTESQATDRAMAAGLTNVSTLKKDDTGVWRGTAADGSKNVNVAIDFKGNVVAN
jgi:hypothetical protein